MKYTNNNAPSNAQIEHVANLTHPAGAIKLSGLIVRNSPPTEEPKLQFGVPSYADLFPPRWKKNRGNAR
jgi:hypothetical protein